MQVDVGRVVRGHRRRGGAVRRSRRRCSECNELFSPHPRVVSSQRACSKPECQRRRHAAAHADWCRRNAGCYRGRAVKHRSYREQVKTGAHVPERMANIAEQVEQDAISAQAAQEQALGRLSPRQREQDAILVQVVFLNALVARWLRGARASEQDELGATKRAWSSPAFGDAPSIRATASRARGRTTRARACTRGGPP